MRRAYRTWLPRLVVVLILLSLFAPQGAAQDLSLRQTCPEGLVYSEEGDVCLLPEDLPAQIR